MFFLFIRRYHPPVYPSTKSDSSETHSLSCTVFWISLKLPWIYSHLSISIAQVQTVIILYLISSNKPSDRSSILFVLAPIHLFQDDEINLCNLSPHPTTHMMRCNKILKVAFKTWFWWLLSTAIASPLTHIKKKKQTARNCPTMPWHFMPFTLLVSLKTINSCSKFCSKVFRKSSLASPDIAKHFSFCAVTVPYACSISHDTVIYLFILCLLI